MTPDSYAEIANDVIDACRLFGERGWCRATSGNFSARIDNDHCLITQSGREKSRLSIGDLMVCDLHGIALDTACHPSAETPLHTCLYRLDATIGAVLHTHSVTSTVLSRVSGSSLQIRGFEMQKALAGVSSHIDEVVVPVFDNNHDMTALAKEVEIAWHEKKLQHRGFLIRGHGLYAWGEDVQEAARHVDGFEFLFECNWQERLARRQ